VASRRSCAAATRDGSRVGSEIFGIQLFDAQNPTQLQDLVVA